MRFFFTFFIGVFLAQIGLSALILLTGFGTILIYIAYMLPFALVDMVLPLPPQLGAEDDPVSFILILSIPALVYSAVAAAIATFVRNLVVDPGPTK